MRVSDTENRNPNPNPNQQDSGLTSLTREKVIRRRLRRVKRTEV